MENKIHIPKGNTYLFETFMERICENYKLYNYIGAMSMALEYALQLADDNTCVSFRHVKDGVCFSLQTDSGRFAAINLTDGDNTDDVSFIIKHLSDAINISRNGSVMELFFSIDGVEDELVLKRKEKIKTYSLHNLTTVKN